MSLYQCSNHLSNCAGGLAAVRAGGVGIQARGDSHDCAGGLGRERALWGAEYWRRSGAPPASVWPMSGLPCQIKLLMHALAERQPGAAELRLPAFERVTAVGWRQRSLGEVGIAEIPDITCIRMHQRPGASPLMGHPIACPWEPIVRCEVHGGLVLAKLQRVKLGHRV